MVEHTDGSSSPSIYEEVKRLRIEERVGPQEIVRRMGGRVTLTTAKTYCYRAVQEALDASPDSDVEMTLKADAEPPRPFGATHVRVGAKLTRFRYTTLPAREKQDVLTPTAFSNRFRIGNRSVLSLMEKGQHDFTLTELTRIAEVLEVTLVELLSAPS